MAAASLQVAVPRSVLDAVAGHQVLAVVALAGLAVVLAVCSEAERLWRPASASSR
jgi:uncharacterized protein